MTVAELIEILKGYSPDSKIWVFDPLNHDAAWVCADTVDHYGDNVYIM